MFKPVYENYTCPLDESIVVRLLVNPAGAVKTDWARGRIGGAATGCPDCTPGTFCAACSALRAQMGRAWHAVYGETRCAGGTSLPRR